MGVEGLLAAYEQGRVSRRTLVAMITAACAGAAGLATRAGAQAPRVRINHVNFRVGDLDRSLKFYERFFGFKAVRTKTYHALDCGNGTFVSLQTKADIDQEPFRSSKGSTNWARTTQAQPGVVEHVCLEVEGLQLDRLAAQLKDAGYESFVLGGNLFTSDPDGILLQVVDASFRFAHEQ